MITMVVVIPVAGNNRYRLEFIQQATGASIKLTRTDGGEILLDQLTGT